jgi:hypothetical protein
MERDHLEEPDIDGKIILSSRIWTAGHGLD